MSVLVGMGMPLGAAIAVFSGASGWGWVLVGLLVGMPWFLLASRNEMRTLTESKEALLLELEAVKQPGRLHAPDDATVEPTPQDGS